MFISDCCCSKLLQRQWLKTTKTYCLTVVKVRSLKSGCRQGCIPSGKFRRECFLTSASFYRPPASLGYAPPLALLPPPSAVITSLTTDSDPPSHPYEAPCDYIWPTWMFRLSHLKILNVIIFANFLYQVR